MIIAILIHFIMGAIAPRIIDGLQTAICEYNENKYWLIYDEQYNIKLKQDLYMWLFIAFSYIIVYAVVIYVSVHLLSIN